MAILFSFLFITYLLDFHIPVDDATKLISSVLNSKFITSAITFTISCSYYCICFQKRNT